MRAKTQSFSITDLVIAITVFFLQAISQVHNTFLGAKEALRIQGEAGEPGDRNHRQGFNVLYADGLLDSTP